MPDQPEVPQAIVQTKRTPNVAAWRSPWWIVAGVCCFVAAALVFGSYRARGPRITIHFPEGHGVKPGDRLRHRGIEVGEVTAVTLNHRLDGVDVQVSLEPRAAALAREGSRFWIERPQLSLTRISGLETVVGPKFLGVIPGPEGGAKATLFQGLDAPPKLSDSEATEITVRFRDGYGLQRGDPVRHRGIVVGEVAAVELDGDLSGVMVRLRLAAAAANLARAGSQFWIERPRVTVAEVRGLETLVGGRYVAVLPGRTDGESVDHFDGLDLAPAAELPAEALELVLEGPQRWGLERGAPVTYRGLAVGQVTAVRLATDGTRIEARVFVEGRYRSLVRDNSVFWTTSGVDVNIGFRGVQVSAETLSTIAAGGVAFATPPAVGKPVATEHRFTYQKSPRDEWLEWQPHLAVPNVAANGGERPVPLRVVLRWTEKKLGFRRSQERRGWVLWLDDGTFLGPADLLSPVDRALEGTTLEAAGSQYTVVADRVQSAGSLRTFRPETAPDERAVTAWRRARLRAASAVEECLLIAAPQNEPLLVPVERLTADGRTWRLAPSVPVTADWHGAAAVAVKDGCVLGALSFQKGQSQIELVE